MGKLIGSLLLIVLSFQCSFGKAVDENTAKNIGYNFCKSEGVAVAAPGLSLAYTATSSVSGTTVTDFYVFNTGAQGFVIVSGDDNITPVLGYSTESSFNANYIPVNIAEWFNSYKDQINYVIKNNITGTLSATAKWNELATYTAHAAARTTSGTPGTPLCLTKWNQSPYYNALCPYDYSADTNALTGCVATAMAQVMKYWKWPRNGVGSHAYGSAYGTLSADFGHTVYQWDSMPNYITHVDTAIAVLMYDAGVSVNMSYGVTESGAFVNTNTSPVTNCAQYALQTYFSYKSSTLQGVYRSAYTDSDWVRMIKAEINMGRPTIYTGFGGSGGHCWIADGYSYFDTTNRIHFNWGWGGYCNGYYFIESLVPGGTDFNNGQTLMTGIEPDSIVVAGVKDIAVGAGINIYPNPAKDFVNIALHDTKATEVILMDMAGREMSKQAIANNVSTITIPVNDLADGVYLIQLQTAEGTMTKKVTVAR